MSITTSRILSSLSVHNTKFLNTRATSPMGWLRDITPPTIYRTKKPTPLILAHLTAHGILTPPPWTAKFPVLEITMGMGCTGAWSVPLSTVNFIRDVFVDRDLPQTTSSTELLRLYSITPKASRAEFQLVALCDSSCFSHVRTLNRTTYFLDSCFTCLFDSLSRRVLSCWLFGTSVISGSPVWLSC